MRTVNDRIRQEMFHKNATRREKLARLIREMYRCDLAYYSAVAIKMYALLMNRDEDWAKGELDKNV